MKVPDHAFQSCHLTDPVTDQCQQLAETVIVEKSVISSRKLKASEICNKIEIEKLRRKIRELEANVEEVEATGGLMEATFEEVEATGR